MKKPDAIPFNYEITPENVDAFNATQEREKLLLALVETEAVAQVGQDLKNPELVYEPGHAAELADQLANALKDKIFQTGGRLVIVEKLTERRAYGKFSLDKGTTIIETLDVESLSALGNRWTKWSKPGPRGKGYVASDCPVAIAKQLLYNRYHWRNLNTLSGLATCPVIRPNGSLLNQAGYDFITGLYADFKPTLFPSISDMPDKEEAKAALETLLEALTDFPFKSNIDRSVALAGILTAVIRPSIPHAPMFAITAPAPGTGKSTFADMISILANGKPAEPFRYLPDDTELAKSLFAVLLTGPSVILIDNVTDIVNSSTLCTILSQESLNQRILGQSKTMATSTQTIVTITGNNLTIAQDLIRRTLFCQLDAQMERPQERTFKHANLKDWTLQKRGKLIAAALTILRAYHCADCPDSETLVNLAGFEDWSRWIRGALLWLGMADPVESQRAMEELDPIREGAVSLLSAWYNCFGSDAYTTAEIIKQLEKAMNGTETDTKKNDFYQAMIMAVAPPRNLTGRSLGKWLSCNANRIQGGYRIIKGSIFKHSTIWKVEKCNNFS